MHLLRGHRGEAADYPFTSDVHEAQSPVNAATDGATSGHHVQQQHRLIIRAPIGAIDRNVQSPQRLTLFVGDHVSTRQTCAFGFRQEGYRVGQYVRDEVDVDAILMARDVPPEPAGPG